MIWVMPSSSEWAQELLSYCSPTAGSPSLACTAPAFLPVLGTGAWV